MRFEFAKYTDVTKYAKEVTADDYHEFYDMYDKVLICPDTHDAWIAKIQTGYNKHFEVEEGAVLIERNLLDSMGVRHNNIINPNYCLDILKADMEDGSNWDVYECESMEEALEVLEGGFGIIGEEA